MCGITPRAPTPLQSVVGRPTGGASPPSVIKEFSVGFPCCAASPWAENSLITERVAASGRDLAHRPAEPATAGDGLEERHAELAHLAAAVRALRVVGSLLPLLLPLLAGTGGQPPPVAGGVAGSDGDTPSAPGPSPTLAGRRREGPA